LIRDAGLPDDPELLRAEVARWHARKTELYTQAVAAGALAPRPGVRRLMREALDAGWALAVASTSAEVSVRAILDHVAGDDARHVGVVVAGDAVARKKPAPDVYDLAIERLGVEPPAVVAIEDSRNGLLAAVGAKAACLVTVNDYTRDEDFAEARIVVDSLGDPGQPPIAVLENRTSADPGAWISLADVRACLHR
jgi:HAD superfamily hydrolase (TIGR01509 family)